MSLQPSTPLLIAESRSLLIQFIYLKVSMEKIVNPIPGRLFFLKNGQGGAESAPPVPFAS